MVTPHIQEVKPVPIPVTFENYHRWTHLLKTAVERGLTVHPLGGSSDWPHHTYRFLVSSHSETGIAYEVAIQYSSPTEGDITMRENLRATCSCRAGEFGNPCTHSAIALDDDTYGPFRPRAPLGEFKVDPAKGLAAIMAPPKDGR